MKPKSVLLLAVFLNIFAGGSQVANAQSEPVLYFCEVYNENGEEGVSDRFTKGYLTVIIKCDYELGLTDVSIQFDKYNPLSGKFDYYKKFSYSVTPDMNYIFFSKNDDSDMSFDQAGIYRVFLLDEQDRTVASAIVEIID
jgi:hypothetical protein